MVAKAKINSSILVLLLSVFTIALTVGCSATQTPINKQSATSHHLTREQAEIRAERISNVNYFFDINLGQQKFFTVVNRIEFDLSDTNKPLRLDIAQAQISKLTINDKFLYPSYNGHYLEINPKLLRSGANKITLTTRLSYSHSGEGLHQFVDPQDGKTYLYSHFQPAAAHKVFALFDQSDIKAKFHLTVTAPKDWQVISTTKETSVTDKGMLANWQFLATPAISPYTFSLHAGPYFQWQDNTGPYPLRLFARQSIADKVNPRHWFGYTQQGLSFFDDYFDIPYPFKKYDQILVPEFRYGAMENTGASTFSEDRFLTSTQMTSTQRQQLANVIMHELAHQWFGNLVTMRWWNGLWLNESFASMMATLALEKATEFNHAWRRFYTKGKRKAYELDSAVTTHPIEVNVPSTANAFDNINAITYSKGAAVLNQLRHLLGAKAFQNGVSRYLKTYSYTNAQIDDFIASLSQSAGQDLSHWQRSWLDTAGVNTLKVELTCQQDFIESIALKQLPAKVGAPLLRHQKVQLILFAQGYSGLTPYLIKEVEYDGKRTEFSQLRGLKCPSLVYPNFEDWGYAKVILDPISFATAQAQLNQIQNPLLRSMLWQSLWDAVLDSNLSLKQFLGTVFVNAPKEQDLVVLNQIIGYLTKAKFYLDSLNIKRITAKENTGDKPRKDTIGKAKLRALKKYKDLALSALEQMSLRKTIESAEHDDYQTLWFDNHIEFATTPRALDYLVQLLEDKAHIKGLTLSQEQRWRIIHALNRNDHPSAKYWLEKESQLDQSNAGLRGALAAKVARPEAKSKRDYLSVIFEKQLYNKATKPNLNTSMQLLVMDNLYPRQQTLLSQATAELRLEKLIALDKHKSAHFMRRYTQTLLPSNCNLETLKAYEERLPEYEKSLTTTSLRGLKLAYQEVKQCLEIHNNL